LSRIRLKIEGKPGEIELASFIGILSRASQILGGLDSAISERPHGALRWYIADLQIGSAVAVIESRPKTNEIDAERVATMVGSSFVDGLSVIERNVELPPYFSEQDLTRVKQIAGFLKRTASDGVDVAHLNGGVEPLQETTLRQDAGAKVNQLLRAPFQSIGSVAGQLEMISLHRTPKFNVYDVVTHKAVSCRFEPDRLEEITAALGKRVVVTGIVHRNAKGEPVRVEKPGLRVLRPDAELPTVADLIGLAPDLTGQLSVDDHVRLLRNG
jgi:fructose 1,6-bisphosphatase